ncbi:PAS domain-containing sensor histidine kinase [Acuticoccus sp. M5D2P5]|uniref:sensor histidine kinase NtrY-like n=1 Tax=Acuticoccus kalidii TaxID=2910977 RepID=UPI001F290F30|nr:PAS domain-containing sensor histidine kinase [Acuticoccus kalidii]MCF3932580.1 PAS domain-containing sensor histidine kinase [Acuticoccus kalidii]
MSDATVPYKPPFDSPVRSIGVVLIPLALLACAATFLILTGLTPITPTSRVIIVALLINGVLVMLLMAGVGYEIIKLWRARSARRAGARLHVRIVALFSIMAVLPAALVAVVATLTLSRGLDRWFEERTHAIVANSVAVADAYVGEHAAVLRSDLVAMARDMDRAEPIYSFEPTRFDAFFQTQAGLRQLPSAFLLNGAGEVLTKTVINPEITLRMPPPDAMREALKGEPVLIAPGEADQVGGIMKLDAYQDTYLYIARLMDPQVNGFLRLTRANAQEYIQMENSRLGVSVAFGLVYAGITMVLLVCAIYLGFGFANRLVAPIRELIGASDAVAKGDLNVEVPVRFFDGDIAQLGETFNGMTETLRNQREELVAANDQLDSRRRFTEAVLGGVTAGVIGIDADDKVTLANPSALNMLDLTGPEIVGKRVSEAVPELAPVLDTSEKLVRLRVKPEQISLRRKGRERTISIRATIDRGDVSRPGYVLTLDDITDLVTAQRTSAWADVARRIAHEIKNPLTPIQLSAERIKRRYGKRIEDDREVFDQCVDTIVRQVDDIGRMVNEFSNFARMPAPAMERRDVRDAVREAVFLQGIGHASVVTETQIPDRPVIADFDQRLVTQALSNLVKNAAEAIEQTSEEDRGGEPGRIRVRLYHNEAGEVVTDIIDNGIGLPKVGRERILEPYMTTREKGTGLGLAIVKKIAEEQGGRIELLDAAAVSDNSRGACIRFVLPGLEIEAQTQSASLDGEAVARDEQTESAAEGHDGNGAVDGSSTASRQVEC